MLLANALALWGVLQSGYIIILLVVLLSLLFYLRQWRRQGNETLLLQGNECTLERITGEREEFILGRRHLVTNFLVILQLKELTRQRTRNVVLFCDALDADAFRRLKVLMRFPVSPERLADNSTGLR